MGRPERPLDLDGGPLARFAADLRALRRRAGGESYRAMARRANYSATTLAQAAAGQQLPSLEVTLAYVAACGGDREEWETRWYALDAELAARRDVPGGAPDDPARGRPAEPLGDRPVAVSAARTPAAAGGAAWANHRLAVAVAACTALVAVGGAGFGIGRAGGPTAARAGAEVPAALAAAPVPTAPPAPTPHDGGDPILSGCAGDAVTLATSPLVLRDAVRFGPGILRAGTSLGAVLLRYSPHCAAAWAKLMPSGAITQPEYARVAVTVERPSDRTGITFRDGHLTDAYTDVVLTTHGCAYAQATVTSDSGRSLTASTVCRVD